MTPKPAPQAAPAARRNFRWDLLAAIAILCAAVALAFSATIDSLIRAWSDTDGHTYTHGILIVAVCIWLLWREVDVAGRLPVRPVVWALIPLVLLAFASLVVQRSGIEIGHQLLLPLIIWLAIFAALGWHIARRCAFAVAYLYFAIPIWSHINEPLRALTVDAVQFLLRAFGIPAYFVGNHVEIPSGLFEIEDGCSGLHFLIVAMALAALFGELQRDRLRVRVRHLVVAAGLAVIANWLRVFTIIVAGHLTQMQHYLVRVDHYYFGWLVFALAMVVFFGVSRGAPGARQPGVARSDTSNDASALSLAMPLVLAVTAVGLLPAIVHFRDQDEAKAAVLAQLPAALGSWAGPESRDPGWTPAFAGADAEAGGQYSSGGSRVDLYVAAYGEQYQGKELIGYGNSANAPFRELSRGHSSIGSNTVSEQLVVGSAGNHWLIWTFYVVDSRRFASGVASQLWYGFRSLLGPVGSGVLALRTQCAADCEQARATLREFLGQMDAIRSAGSRTSRDQFNVLDTGHD